MKVKELMRTPLPCRPSTDLATAARLMRYGKCSFLPVIGTRSEVLGWITDRDVAMAPASRHVSAVDLKVETVMSPSVRSCCEEDSIDDAVALMSELRLRQLPVTDAEGRLHGVLFRRDLASEVESPRPGRSQALHPRRR